MSSVKLIKLVVLPILLSVPVLGELEGTELRVGQHNKTSRKCDDRLLKKDLNTYVNALGRVVGFFNQYKEDIDMYAELGLFLAKGKNVYLTMFNFLWFFVS